MGDNTPPGPPRKKWGVGTVILGILAVLVLGCLGLALLGTLWSSTPAGQASKQAEIAACADAVERVKAYKAPGQQLSILANVTIGMAAERRPVKIDGWEPPAHPSGSDFCAVTFRATIGNEPQRFVWYYTPKNGQVEATNDATKRLSGW